MPQDIPLEASEELCFTPASLKDLGDAAPSFTLRAVTSREKRHLRRLHVEEEVVFHQEEALRSEILHGLATLWRELPKEEVDQHIGMVRDYWSALDEWKVQRDAHDKEQAGQSEPQPFPAFAYDPEIADGVRDLLANVSSSWRPYRKMIADNADFPELMMPLTVAVCVKSWARLEAKAVRERGYFTPATAEALATALAKFEKANGLPQGVAWAELFIACNKRMYLDEDEEKNSASPSPSETTPPASNPTSTSEPDGKSPASARSKKTRATA